MLEIPFLISAFVTLFVVIDPIGTAPLFLALTQGMTAKQRRTVGLRACFIAALLLMAFAVAGEDFLNFIGISMPAFQIAGGLFAVSDGAGHAVRPPLGTASEPRG